MAIEPIVLVDAPQWWEITAARAMTVSAAVIAWQAWQTRKSVAATEKAVTVAQAPGFGELHFQDPPRRGRVGRSELII